MSKEIQDYIDSVQDERRILFLKLHELVFKLFPEVKIKISYQMPFYTTTKGWLFLGYWKQGVSLHVGYLDELDNFRLKHPKIKTGKGSINLKLTDEIPWKDVGLVINKALSTRTSSMRS
jgi:uncharacterized protein YdhG (YjbR/CyaY superfamily)